MKLFIKVSYLMVLFMCSMTVTAQKNLLSACTSVEDSVATIKTLLQQNESKFIGHEAKDLFVQINTLFPIRSVVPICTNEWNDPRGESYVEGITLSPYDEDEAVDRIWANIPQFEINIYFEEPYETWDDYIDRIPQKAFGKRELSYSNKKVVRNVKVDILKYNEEDRWPQKDTK